MGWVVHSDGVVDSCDVVMVKTSDPNHLYLEEYKVVEKQGLKRSPDTREQSGQPVIDKRRRRLNFCSIGSPIMIGFRVTLSSGFCVATEWEVVCLGGTTLVEVILVKGHKLPTVVKVLPIGFHLNPTSVNT
ncbi:hypothetical protein Tco_1376570 [Tanacetum coccineum]